MRKTLLAAAAALLFLLPAAQSPAAPLGFHDPPERDEYRFRWGEDFSTRYQKYFSSPNPDRTLLRNQAGVYCEFGGYDWSLALRGGASTFDLGDSSEWDPHAYVGAGGKAIIWSRPGSAWTGGATLDLDQSMPFDVGGSRPGRISGLYDATLGFGVQKRQSEKQTFYGGTFYSLSGFSYEPRYTLDNGTRPGGASYKLKDHIGFHGGVAWTLPSIDLLAEGQVTPTGLSAGVSFRLPLDGGPSAILPRSIRELFGGWGERPADEKDGRFETPVRDDGPEEIRGEEEGGR